jgi:hypothetical protein
MDEMETKEPSLTISRDRSGKKQIALGYFAVLLCTLVLYYITCSPSTLWQDGGMFQYRIWNNDIKGNLGLALAHPLYHYIGIMVKQIPLGEFGFRINLISVMFGAITIANIFLLLRLWLLKSIPALLGAMTLAFSWTFWQQAVFTEVYTLYSAFLTAELIFLMLYIRSKYTKFLYLLALFNGLSIANHMFGVIPLACYFVFIVTLLIKKELRLQNLGIAAALWIIGALPYGYLIVKDIIDTGDIIATIRSVFFGSHFSGMVLNTSMSLRIIIENFIFIGYNFATPNIILFVIGIASINKLSSLKSFAKVILAVTILFLIFAFRYSAPDRYAFFLPFYCMASIFIGVGADFLFMKYNKKILLAAVLVLSLLPIPIYAIAPVIAEKMQVKMGTRRQIPYRSEYAYFLRPWQARDNNPVFFGRDALNTAENNAVVIGECVTVYVLWYSQVVEGINPGAKILSINGHYENPIDIPTEETIANLMKKGPVYVVTAMKGYCPQFMLDNYDFVPKGPLYQLVVRK